jgi:hypothetical protein
VCSGTTVTVGRPRGLTLRSRLCGRPVAACDRKPMAPRVGHLQRTAISSDSEQKLQRPQLQRPAATATSDQRPLSRVEQTEAPSQRRAPARELTESVRGAPHLRLMHRCTDVDAKSTRGIGSKAARRASQRRDERTPAQLPLYATPLLPSRVPRGFVKSVICGTIIHYLIT